MINFETVMAMTFSLRENADFSGAETRIETISSSDMKFEDVHICSAKLKIPQFVNFTERPRLQKLLEKTSEQFGATLVTGRAGTGKTALASGFARKYEQVAWYSIDAADNSWKVFSSYLCASFNESRLNLKCNENFNVSETEIAGFIENLFSRLNVIGKKKPLLIVLDDIHHIYDCDWFQDFFKTLLRSLIPTTHLIMLSRSQPPLPLWRLRSKQVLGVIDEKLLAMTLAETEDLFNKNGLSKKAAEKFHKESFGRISKINLSE